MRSSSAAREQEWEEACADGNYELAGEIAYPSVSSLPITEQLTLIRFMAQNGFALTEDAVRVHGILSEEVLEGGTPLDLSIFDDIDFLEDLIEGEAQHQ